MNLDKLDAAIAYIEAYPEQWNQAHWFVRDDGGCGTGSCLAGTISLLNGWLPTQWADIDHAEDRGETTAMAIKDGVERDIAEVAAEILDLGKPWTDPDNFELHPLFRPDNDLDDIKWWRDRLAEGGEAGERSDTQNDLPESS